MKKTAKVVAAVVAFMLVAGILYVTNAFVGNPVSKALAKRKIEQYIADEYAQLELELVETNYNFKFGEYVGRVQSKTSEDTFFHVSYRGGEIKYDDYDWMVEERENTIQRFEKEYSNLIRDVIKNEMDYENNSNVMYTREEENIKDILQLDMPFDPFVRLNAEVWLDIAVEDPTTEKVVQIIKDIHEVFVTKGYHFDKYHFSNYDGEVKISFYGITPKEIESDDFIDILKKKDHIWE